MNDNAKIVTALLLGAAAGAIVGLLFAPDKGSETRKKIMSSTDDLIDQLQEKINEGKSALSDLKSKAMGKAEELKNKAQQKADELKEEAKDEIGNMKSKVRHAANSHN